MKKANMAEDLAAVMADAMQSFREGQCEHVRRATQIISKTLQSTPARRDPWHNPNCFTQSGVKNQPAIDRLGHDLCGRLRKGSSAMPRIMQQRLRSSPNKQMGPGPLGRFIEGSYENAFGIRGYHLYIPTVFSGQPLPLVVMLHGCTQNALDFAAGTRMNEVGEKNNCFVLYPVQAQTANVSRCWNWFKSGDQRRDVGEPSIIADMTRHVSKNFHVDTTRVFVAGMSAGGAMAMILAAVYPDLYAAAGIHSGLPYGAAKDLASALTAMRDGATGWSRCEDQISVIVFHGEQDNIVHPRNGALIVAQSQPSNRGPQSEGLATEQGIVRGRRGYSRTIYADPSGRAFAEYWLIQNAGHAWAGGSNQGSFTDPEGPDASSEMMRFFLSAGAKRNNAHSDATG